MSVLLWKAWERLFNVDKKVSSWISHFDVRDVQWIQSNAGSYHFLCQVLLNLFVPSILWALPLPLLGADFQTQKHDDAVHRVNMSSVPKKDAEVVLTHPDGSEIPPRKVQIMWMVLLVNKKHYNIKLFYLCLVWCFLLTAVSLFISCFFCDYRKLPILRTTLLQWCLLAFWALSVNWSHHNLRDKNVKSTVNHCYGNLNHPEDHDSTVLNPWQLSLTDIRPFLCNPRKCYFHSQNYPTSINLDSSLDLVGYHELPLLSLPTWNSWEAGCTCWTRHNIPLYLGHRKQQKALLFRPLFHSAQG